MKKTVILLVVITVVLLSGCGFITYSGSSSQISVSISSSQEAENPQIKGTTKDTNLDTMTVYKELNYSIAKDKEGYIKILTAAKKDDAGEIMWDDGQDFAVEVFNGSEYFYIMPKQYIQLGTVEVKIFEDMDDDTVHILVDTTQGAGIKVMEYTYNRSNSTFTMQVILENGNINYPISTYNL